MNTRDWPIRSKLTALVVVPVTALLALWIFATTLTFGPALDLLAARTLLYDLGRPGEVVVAELQRERRLSTVFLARAEATCERPPAPCALPELTEQRERTDTAIAELRRRISGDALRDAASDLLDARLDRLVTDLEALPVGRTFIDRRAMDRAGAVGLYSGMITSAFRSFAAMADLPDQNLNRQALAVTALGRSRELLGQVDSLLAGALAAGRFDDGEHTQLVQTIGNQRFLTETAVADLPETDRVAYQRLTEQDAFGRLRSMQDDIVAAGRTARPPVDAQDWTAAYDDVWQALRDYELSQADGLADRSVPTAVRILVRLAAAGLLGLVAVVASLLVAVRVGRSLAQRLTLVRRALERSERRLPEVVDRLRRGEEVDLAREAPVLDHGADEIGQVARAFIEVQKVAIRAATDEVTLRRGLSEVFLNIARRSQGLVHRQLALLDRMERDTEDPDELADLFRVDHLSTRLRRHAEDLVILAGAAPGRGWRNPVAVVDLIRGAISEVESYDRVDTAGVHPAGVLGRAVGDVIHLLAELIENATVFSPPDTRVEVRGELVANGYALSITDRGLGMSAAAIAEANQRLAEPPDFDPGETARLGLFVVARLAARHAVRVRLRPSDTGGLTAVVLIPGELVTEEPSTLPASAGGPSAASGGDPERRRLARATRLATVPRPRAARSTRQRPEPVGGSDAYRPAGPAGDDGSSAVDGEIDGLPRRVRRRGPAVRPRPATDGSDRPAAVDAAPQDPTDADRPVMDAPTAAQPVVRARPAVPSPRSPEDARRVMSALQAGTSRGRRAAGGPTPSGGAADRPEITENPIPTERDA
ncbi:Signal transduction histidine kinase [Micromonospora nigra]|uniref:histidine kinase n=1 Tax=Micromonospora nigra TaxID=145857 RepID=A0A1C6RMJ2_9ACTN|nr:nitrate- and nitrite sensing domain-containing protein [Micromonospora nigra]SCL18398.1 Signal transduction histidine kinase [Micromonospora nigra]